jgi:hypothetical protein
MASIAFVTAATHVSRTETAKRTDTVRRIANLEMLLTSAFLLAACVFHLI